MTDQLTLASSEPLPPDRGSAPPPTVPPSSRAALSGAIAATAALGVGELLAGLVRGIPSPLSAVGTAAIDFAPAGSKEIVISLFGTNDKAALLILVGAIVLAAGAGIGVLARRNLTIAGLLVVALVAIGGLASLRDPTAIGPLVVVASALQAGVGLQVLVMLLAAARPVAAVRATGGAVGTVALGSRRAEPIAPRAGSPERRTFLLQAGAIGAFAVVGGGVGRSLLGGRAAAQANATVGDTGTGATGSAGSGSGKVTIPQAVDPAPTPGADASLSVAGITPLVIANDKFYKIDTAFFPPAIDIATWNLRVFGMVDKEIRLSFTELVQLPLIERYVTIACVSNEVGGNLVGNAKWTGVRLSDVLEMVGVHADATQIVPRSVDGWTAGFPTSWVTDKAHPRDAMIAVKMNDQPLPVDHGFPARLIVPGLYGYVSATKWLTEIELTTLEAIDAYWVPRGWAKEAPILTQSRIDVPQTGSRIPAGPVAIAGVAWAPDRSISKVEVRVDQGPWQAATLATEISATTWVQWKWTWQATDRGVHIIEVRATDGTGEVQTDQASPPDPDGARGHHKIQVEIQ